MSRIHIIGAGLAGLSAAIAATGGGRAVTLYESTAAGGGRCRSYLDPELGIRLDNGNHLLLSGNASAFAYIDAIGARDRISGPRDPLFPFLDIRTGRSWSLRPSRGRIPWWLLSATRRAPKTTPAEYLSLSRLGREWDDTVIAETMRHGSFYWFLVEPLSIAALNTRPHEGLACLFGAVLRETLMKGGKACLPRMAREGLSEALVDPALDTLRQRGATLLFNHRITGLESANGRVTGLIGTDGVHPVAPGEEVVLAVPPWVAGDMLPDLIVPNAFESILNVHYRIAATPSGDVAKAGFIGLINGVAEWVFVKSDHVSVTVSAANGMIDRPAEELAKTIWPNVVDALDLPAGQAAEMPPFRVIKERRATFVANVAQEERRPDPQTPLANLKLAGDWTDTRLPATIEGAIRSGATAARLILDPPKSETTPRRKRKHLPHAA